MGIVKDVIDGLETVKQGIESIRAISDAIKDGKDYIKVKHPEAKSALAAMIAELRKNLLVVAEASAVLTRFRFAFAQDTGSAELARFNDYFIEQKSQAARMRQAIDTLRTHCHVVREHAVKITGEATATGFAKLFALFGLKSPMREAELGVTLDRLAYEDFQIARTSETMLTSLERALKEVQLVLESGGAMRVENVPAAAAVLREYALEFEKLEQPAEESAKQISELINDLR